MARSAKWYGWVPDLPIIVIVCFRAPLGALRALTGLTLIPRLSSHNERGVKSRHERLWPTT